jgi:hypothetical protein
VELPCRQGEAPPLLEVDGRTLTVVVDHRNVDTLFPSMPEDMKVLLQSQLCKLREDERETKLEANLARKKRQREKKSKN